MWYVSQVIRPCVCMIFRAYGFRISISVRQYSRVIALLLLAANMSFLPAGLIPGNSKFGPASRHFPHTDGADAY